MSRPAMATDAVAATRAGAVSTGPTRRGPAWRAWLAALVVAMLVATGLAAWVPPMQSPDENQHVARGHLLAHGVLELHAPKGMMSGGDVDPALARYIDGFLQGLAGDPAKRLAPDDRAALEALRWTPGPETSFLQIPGTGYYLPLAYLPHALGLGLGELFGLTVHHSYLLARGVVQAFVLAILAAAWAIRRPPPLALAVLALPMTMFQLVSPTIDGLTAALAMLVIALTMRHAPREAPPVSPAAIAAMSLALLVIGTTRLHLLPLLATPWFLAWRRRDARLAWAGAAVLAATLAWSAWAIATTVDLRIPRPFTTAQLVVHYLGAPLDALAAIGRTLADPHRQQFYLTSFVGNLGWLDTPLAPAHHRALLIGLLVLAALSPRRPGEPGRNAARALLGVGAGVSFVLAFGAMLVSFTPLPVTTIEGVQGRYFLIPALALAWAWAGDGHRDASASTAARVLDRLRWAALAAYAAGSTWVLVVTLQARFP